MSNDHDFFQLTAIIAQDAPELGGGVPDTGAGTGGGGGATGGGGGGGGAGGPGGSNLIFLLFILFLFVIVWSFMGQRRERKKREAMLSAIRKHDRVQTVGGVIGSVVDVKPDMVVLKVDEASNTRMTFARSAIQQVLTERTETEKEGGDAAQ